MKIHGFGQVLTVLLKLKLLGPDKNHLEENFTSALSPSSSSSPPPPLLYLLGKIGRKDGQPLPGEDEPLHAYVTATTTECVKKGVEAIKKVIKEGIDVSIV